MSSRKKQRDYLIGHSKPPAATRFPKGQSGNPRGRPPGRKNGLPHDAVLGQMVTICVDGQSRRVTAAEAFLMQTTRNGLNGDGAAARDALRAITEARARRLQSPRNDIRVLEHIIVDPGSVNHALEPLRMATKLDRYRPTARIALEPWIVEAALDRLGDSRLTVEEQKVVVSATRTPWKVNWPHWWTVRT